MKFSKVDKFLSDLEASQELYTQKYVDKKDKEIERLNNLLKETSQTLSEQTTKAITLKSENERLNNIINETKKILLLNFDTTTTIFNALNKLSEVDKQ